MDAGAARPLDYGTWLASIAAAPEAALEAVRARISFRPYRGPVKGARGAFTDGTANSRDASELLLAVLRAKGFEGRLVRGVLADADARALLAAVFGDRKAPPEVREKLPGGDAHPLADARLLAAVRLHTWVQVREGGHWVDLDPVRPGGPPREGPAGKPAPPGPAPRRLAIDVRVRRQGPAAARTVLHFERDVRDLQGRRISYLHEGLAPESRSDKPAPEMLRPLLVVGDRVLRGRPFSARPVAGGKRPGARLGDLFGHLGGAPEGKLESVWMDLRLTGGGRPGRRERRYLYIAGEDGLDRLDDITSYCVTFGAPPAGLLRKLAESAAKRAEEAKDLRLPAAGKLTKEQEKRAAALFLGALDATAAAACWVADRTHRLLAPLDSALGTVSDYGDARVIGVSLDPRRGRIGADLVFDSVVTWAGPGTRASAALALRTARGRLAAEVEGAALAGLLPPREGEVPGRCSAGMVFAAAERAKTGIRVLARENRGEIGKLPLSRVAKRILGERIAEGRLVVIPAAPVEVGGRKALAWYEIDRTTGEWRGVSPDGRHQDVVELRPLYEEVAFGVGVCLSYIMAFSGQLYNFAGSMLKNIGSPGTTYRAVLARALADSLNTTWYLNQLPQAFGDFVGAISGPQKIPLALAAGQAALEGGVLQAYLFLRANFRR